MKRGFWILLLTGLLSLVACNQQTGSNTSNTASSEEALSSVITSEAPVNAAFVATATASAQRGAILPLPPFLLAGPFYTASLTLTTYTWNCQGVTASGDLSDPDADGIPASAHYSGSCSVSADGTTYTWTLNYDLQDTNNADPLSGFSASGELTWEASGQAKLVWTIDKHEVTKAGSGYDLTYQGSWEYTDYTDSSNNTNASYNFSGTWTPDDPNGDCLADVFDRAGTINLSGSIDVSGSCTANVTFNPINVHLNDDYCADSGNISVSGTDCNGNTCATVSWSSCAGPYQGSTSCN
ncbi:hypothetical protein [Oceanithermus sp.]